MNSSYSEWVAVQAGVVQGSILGPLLFNVFIDSVTSGVNEGTTALKYADDMLLFKRISNDEERHRFQHVVNSVSREIEQKGLRLNATKSELLFCSESSSPFIPDAITVGGTEVQSVKVLPYLGVKVDARLKWDYHTDSTVTKAKRMIGHFLRVGGRKNLPLRILKQVIFQSILPVLLYCQTVCYPYFQKDRLSLERLNRYICRVTANDYRTPYLELLRRIDGQPFYVQVIHRRILLAHRYASGRRHLPENTIQPFVQDIRLRNRTYNRGLEVVHRTHVSTSQYALECVISLWNGLNEEAAVLNTAKLKVYLHKNSYETDREEYRNLRHAIRVL